jgi:hypothetical protein
MCAFANQGAAFLETRGRRRSPAFKMWVAPREGRPRGPRGILTTRLRKGWERVREGFSRPDQVFVPHVRGLAICGPGRRPPLRVHSPHTRGSADPLGPGQGRPRVRSPRGGSVAGNREDSGGHASVPRIWGQPTARALNALPLGGRSHPFLTRRSRFPPRFTKRKPPGAAGGCPLLGG